MTSEKKCCKCCDCSIAGKYDPAPYELDLNEWPTIATELPGPKSQKMHAETSKFMKGLSGQVRLFPVAFSEGKGCTLTDVDGNKYIDFSSGIYVTNMGHCHPRISEAVATWAHRLMNAHDFTTPIKHDLLHKLVDVLPGDFAGVQFYDSGTTAVEAALRTARAATGKHEFLSCFSDFHGKSGGSVSLARMNKVYGPTRAPGFYMVPRPDAYRPWWTRDDGTLDTEMYLKFYDKMLFDGTTNQVAAIVLEPIQGWAGTIMPPDDFFPKLRTWCDEREILLIADEVLTGMGRAGKYLCMEHWDTLPDIVTLGKGLGNGFPVTAMVVREKYADAVDKISASTSYGGNPMACAAALASIEVMEDEGVLEHVQHLEDMFVERLEKIKADHKIVGDVRCKGCLMGVELVKDRDSKQPFDEAGKMVYQKAFQKGLAWIPAGHILRMSPPLIMPDDVAAKAMDMIDEAIGETARELGY